jgi:hypothetical protein
MSSIFSLEYNVESLGTTGKHMQATIFSKIWYSQTVVFELAVLFKLLKHCFIG